MPGFVKERCKFAAVITVTFRNNITAVNDSDNCDDDDDDDDDDDEIVQDEWYIDVVKDCQFYFE